MLRYQSVFRIRKVIGPRFDISPASETCEPCLESVEMVGRHWEKGGGRGEAIQKTSGGS